ncbi:MAG: hypothetical protein CSA38_04145 [Flavobacteriales bacterium]|nr:MAG: hypothetical protein CSA38_04145 [Flavobacteriales bacterium]
MNDTITKRIYAYFIDMLVLCIPLYIVIIIFWDDMIKLQPNKFLYYSLFLQFVPFLLYFFISEFIFLSTVGKKVMKLKVSYEKNRFLSILIRTLSRLIPLELISFLILKDQLLHDKISKTKVYGAMVKHIVQ